MTIWRIIGLAIAVGTAAAFDASQKGVHSSTTAAAQDPSTRTDSIGVVLAAGDIAACTEGAYYTALLLDRLPGEILVLGDAAYASRRNPNPYRTCYDSTWGRHKERTHPVQGNHDVELGMARKYFEYFGAKAGPRPEGYYSFNVGQWHVLALNSTIPMTPRSKQGRWVTADLAANQAKCTLAFMHHPRFSSGPHSKLTPPVAVFPVLEKAGVDIVISAHDHIYERFAPMNADGETDTLGIRQFVVGTGGNGLYEIAEVRRNSEARSNESFGVLKLTLEPASYRWEFVSITPGSYSDTGSTRCH
jgi:hypothetical protein